MPIKQHIAVFTPKAVRLVAWCDVLYFDYDKSLQAWLLHTCDGHCHKLRKGITAEQILGWHTELLRANKGCIVNAAHIDGIEYATLQCTLRTAGVRLAFSRACYDAFCARYAE